MTTFDTAQQRLAHARVAATMALLEIGDFDRAVSEAAEAYRLSPGPARMPYAQALLARGCAALRDGDVAAGDADLKAALALAPAPYLAVVADALLNRAQPGGDPPTMPEPPAPVAPPAQVAPPPALSASPVPPSVGESESAPAAEDGPPEPAQFDRTPVVLFAPEAGDSQADDLPLEPIWAERLNLAALREAAIGVALDVDTDRFVTASNDQNLRIYQTGDGTLQATLAGHTSRVWCVDFLDADHLISAALDRTIRIWSAAGGAPLQTFKGHTDGVWCMALAGDRSIVATGSSDRTARVWQIVDGRELQTFKAHDGSVAAVALAPHNDYLATGSRDGLVRIWDLQQAARPLAKIRTSTSRIESLAFAPDQPLLAAAVGASIWLIDRERWEVQERLNGHTNQVTALQFAPGLDLLASASADGSVRFWRVSTGMALDTLMIAPNGIAGMALAPSGEAFVAAIADKSVRYWVLAPPEPTESETTDEDASID
jgi:hypothetical protein